MRCRILCFLTFLLLLRVSSYAQENISFNRFKGNPIITPGLLPAGDGDDINGPSLIKVPGWVNNKLGKYYLYFAHHKGKYIRLAYSDDLKGPWEIYKPGALQITACKTCQYGLPNFSVGINHEEAE